jgi:MauM/NapG family ferredoxin protein
LADLAKKQNRRVLTFLVRCFVLIMAITLALQILPWKRLAVILPSLSPFVAICSALAVRTLSVITLLALPLFIMALWRSRWFCRNLCPVGFLSENIRRFRQPANPNFTKLPLIGQWVVLLTVGGAILGYPLFLLLDPLGIFNGFFQALRGPFSAAALIYCLPLLIVLAINFVWAGLWCSHLCPLGAIQVMLFRLRGVFWHKILYWRELSDSNKVLTARRDILALGTGVLTAVATRKLFRGRALKLIRPPGAIDESNFTAVCIRCGNCTRACPAGIIKPDPGRYGVASFMTPTLRFENNYCQEDCNSCNEVCPSGAIAGLSLAEKRKTTLGLAKVDMSICLLSEERECTLCVRICPYDAIKLVFSEEDYISIPEIDPDKCTGCGACEWVCPVSPKKAITIEAVSRR